MAKSKSKIKVARPRKGKKLGCTTTAYGLAPNPARVAGYVVGKNGLSLEFGKKQRSRKKTWYLKFNRLPKGPLVFFFFDVLDPTSCVRITATGICKKKSKSAKKRKQESSILTISDPDSDDGVFSTLMPEGGSTKGKKITVCTMTQEDTPNGSYDAKLISHPEDDSTGTPPYWSAEFDLPVSSPPLFRLDVADDAGGTDFKDHLDVSGIKPPRKKRKKTKKKK